MRGWLGVGALALAVAVAACDGGEVSDISYDAAKEAKAGQAGGLAAWAAAERGKTVRWTGHVVRAQTVRGDDFVEEGILYVDMDAGEAGSEGPDVVMDIKASDVEGFTAGQPVTYVATIREVETGPDGPLLKLQLDSIE